MSESRDVACIVDHLCRADLSIVTCTRKKRKCRRFLEPGVFEVGFSLELAGQDNRVPDDA